MIIITFFYKIFKTIKVYYKMKCNTRCYHNYKTMYLKCDLFDKDKHLHCITCGKILDTNELLEFLSYDELYEGSKFFETRQSCQKLTNHLN